jgi:DNA-binding MarR family transcriptional regulator
MKENVDLRQSYNAREKQRLAAALHALEPFRSIRRTLPMQYMHAFLLVALDEGLGVMEYARQAGVAQSVMSRHLLDLGDRSRYGGPGYGLLTTRADPLNLRRHRVTLTDKGRDIAQAIMRAIELSACDQPSALRDRAAAPAPPMAPPEEPMNLS